ncbi:MAG: FHA domain-containing protein [Sandaracinaceae bacterium]
MDVWLEIIREDGTLERQRIEGEQVTVGRSPAAGIPIVDARTLEPEHLMLAPRDGGCWVAVAQGAQIPVRVRGQTFSQGMLAWGTELEVANLKLRITDQLPKEKKDPSEKPVSAPVLIAMFVVLPLVGWLLLSDESVGIDATPAAPAPELFRSGLECPVNGGNTRHRADLEAEAAIAKSERYPFNSQDGVQSVISYRRAEACYQALGPTAQTEAQVMRREGDTMQRRIEEDYRTHRLRLERSLEQGRLPDALLETRALIQLLRHQPSDPYVIWLQQLERQLQLAIDSAAA